MTAFDRARRETPQTTPHQPRPTRHDGRRRLDNAQPCPLRPALIPNLIRHGRHRSEHGSPVVCHDIVSGSATEVSVGLEFDEQAVDVPVGTDETLANLVSRKARKNFCQS
ncbi:hypothetical protein OIC43_42985 [Streptomyces sp. NBC_00825]|uniref:hypothetical protein n=1 Tax=unclassified Streptomyces TaxID=2593676 RepID=UPI002251AA12|nr:MULTISPECIES: hypothetical protein [unclassified Streptomyces]WTB60023.1 hypothetical protein OG832_00695 [Streptomyces sp. NBC_00826]WTH95932.1 hypothetical protein OIC43_42985 [Streptomyces sp. NBC_00825]WTI04652.1 hypothetical protein OHA23_42960 [Streptomyces sp. NBC_00822]MCX4869611.1 hypothetical protein [Streptomyces sp. NBC_00906]MCX4900850.1 hypothetical protein [Streptomyces sp. NBC_00892]